MGAHKGDKCSYCGGAIPDGDLWESRSTNQWLAGVTSGASDAWGAAVAKVEQEAAAAFLSKSSRERERAEFLRGLADELREAAKKDDTQRTAYWKKHEKDYPYEGREG